jgi:hypothetical protein
MSPKIIELLHVPLVERLWSTPGVAAGPSAPSRMGSSAGRSGDPLGDHEHSDGVRWSVRETGRRGSVRSPSASESTRQHLVAVGPCAGHCPATAEAGDLPGDAPSAPPGPS